MQVSVLFGILFMLLNNSRVTREEIAIKLEISARSASRYINYLAFNGVPILVFTGPGGGYSLPDDYKLERTFLSADERKRIINCLSSTVADYEDKINDRLIDKITSFNKGDTDSFIFKSDTLIIDSGAWHNPKVYNGKIQVLGRAVETLTTVSFNYIDRHELSTSRLFDPHCIVLKEGIWYAYGYCHARSDFRLFKLARITNLKATEQTFVRREFDIYAKLKGRFDNAELVKVSFEFTSLILPQIEEWLGTDSITDKGTHYSATAELYEGPMLTSKLMSFGSSIKILYPHSIKQDILDECNRIFNNYK